VIPRLSEAKKTESLGTAQSITDLYQAFAKDLYRKERFGMLKGPG